MLLYNVPNPLFRDANASHVAFLKSNFGGQWTHAGGFSGESVESPTAHDTCSPTQRCSCESHVSRDPSSHLDGPQECSATEEVFRRMTLLFDVGEVSLRVIGDSSSLIAYFANLWLWPFL